MAKEKNVTNGINSIVVPLIVGLIIWGVLFLRYGFFYDLNDDVLIKDILSGTYSGTGDIHNMQMLAPISTVLVILYKFVPYVPWMGMLEVFIMFTCFMLVTQRVHELFEQRIKDSVKRRVLIVLFYMVVVSTTLGLFMWEIVMVQYTVVCGLLVTTAAFLFYVDLDDVFEIKNHINSIILVIIAFNIRSEMTLLMLPFLSVVFLIRWFKEGFFHKTNGKFIKFALIVIVGIILSFITNKVAYGGDWKEFVNFFEARTEVYDFTGIPAYEENKEFYNSEAVNEEDYKALISYNFEYSERINTQLLESIADYVKSNSTTVQKVKRVFRAGVNSVKCLFTWKSEGAIQDSGFLEDSMSHGAPGMVVVILYLLCVVMTVILKDRTALYKLPLLFIMRSISWTYIMYRGRVNARIAHPLYLIEITILFAIVITMYGSNINDLKKRRRKRAFVVMAVGMVIGTLISGYFVPGQVKRIDQKAAIRNHNNELCKAMYDYTSSNARKYYVIDVYSSVDFTEKIWSRNRYQKANVQLAGGWITNSLLDAQKQAYYQDKEQWFFISKDDLSEEKILVDTIVTEDESQKLYVYRF